MHYVETYHRRASHPCPPLCCYSCRPQAKLDAAARKVAKRFPDPPKAAQHLAALAAARDNKVFASLQAALALGARSEVGFRGECFVRGRPNPRFAACKGLALTRALQ